MKPERALLWVLKYWILNLEPGAWWVSALSWPSYTPRFQSSKILDCKFKVGLGNFSEVSSQNKRYTKGWGHISLVMVLVQCVQSPEFNAYPWCMRPWSRDFRYIMAGRWGGSPAILQEETGSYFWFLKRKRKVFKSGGCGWGRGRKKLARVGPAAGGTSTLPVMLLQSILS